MQLCTPSGVKCHLSWCTCACESASALSQYQQAVFHHSVTEAHEIRAESTQNNHTELRDNPEPKHQRETGGQCSIYHPTRIRPKEKHSDSDALLLSDPAWHRNNRMWWVSAPEVTAEPPGTSREPCDVIEGNSCSRAFFFKFFFHWPAQRNFEEKRNFSAIFCYHGVKSPSELILHALNLKKCSAMSACAYINPGGFNPL